MCTPGGVLPKGRDGHSGVGTKAPRIMLGYCRMEEGEGPGVNNQQGLPQGAIFFMQKCLIECYSYI